MDVTAKLQNFLQVLAFCLAIATLQVAFMPDRPYGPPMVYSLCIGVIIWAVVDIGRHFFPSSAETGWPPGIKGLALVVAGIALGYWVGNFLADQFCRRLGWYAPDWVAQHPSHLRQSLLITLMSGVVGCYYFYSTNKSGYLERKMTDARRLTSEARLKLLESQLEPHMLFNTLANLRVLITIDAPRAQQMLDHLIAYLRATLDASRATTHSLEAEFDRLRDYLELMAVRMGERLAFDLQLPPELARLPVPALLLQPLVENAIRHGLEPQLQGGVITVAARRDGQALLLEVLDTGVGLETAVGVPQAGQGFGLTQVRERLSTLYGTGATIDLIAVCTGGTRASVRFPVDFDHDSTR